MAIVEIPIGRRQAEARSPFVSSQSLINGFVERDPEPGVPDAIWGQFGLTEFADVGSGPIRGLYTFGTSVLVVSGETLYTVSSAGAGTSRGTIAGTEPVVISDNGIHAAIVADSASYLWDATNLGAITDTDFRTASSVDFLDQYLIFSERNSGVFFISELADAVNYNALDVATAESKPDKLVRVVVDKGEVLLFGERSVESRYNSGNADFPLSKSTTYLDYGLAGRDAICAVDNTVAWLANDFTIRTLRGASPLAVADPAITSMIQGWRNPETARAFSFSIHGHEWMALRHDQGCALWDATTGLWSMRESFGLDTWRVGCAARAFGKVLLGDAINGKIWELDPNAYSEGSDALVRRMVSRTIGPGGAPFTLNRIEVEVEVGVGLATAQGSAPVMWARLSRDGGRTYGARMERSIGAAGNRRLRVIWQGPFGQFPPHGGVIELGCSDPVRFVMTRAWADITADRP